MTRAAKMDRKSPVDSRVVVVARAAQEAAKVAPAAGRSLRP